MMKRPMDIIEEQHFIKMMMYNEGYIAVRRLPTGEFIGVQSLIYTTTIVVGIHEYGYERKYYYERKLDAMNTYFDWTGEGDPSGPWIKEKRGEVGERMNPNMKDI